MVNEEVSLREEKLALKAGNVSAAKRYVYSSAADSASADAQNRVIAVFSIDELIKENVSDGEKEKCLSSDFFFYGGGWQSWGFGGELEPGKFKKRYISLVSQWKQYTKFPGRPPASVKKHTLAGRKLLRGEFIIYLRWGSTYLALCSTGRVDGSLLPPVRYFVNRKKRTITVTIYSDGKKWKKDEKMAEITMFSGEGFFALKDAIKEIYGGIENERFDYLRFLSSKDDKIVTCGWESWYNHYADINHKLISGDLESLDKTSNIIKIFCMDKGKPTVFQVDDGWEEALGQWDVWKERFPEGMTNLASSIAAKGYIPGLWVAPFIIDYRAKIAREHRDWLLRDAKGNYIAAGYAPLWGAKKGPDQPDKNHSYFCFDLSNDEVLDYLDSLMEKIVNEWGFRYIKLDFLFAGMIYGAYKNGGTGYEWYDRAIKKITKRKVNNKGEKVAYLGCGLPLEASYTILPLSRIGPDTKEAWDFDILAKINWEGRPGALPNMQSTLGHAFWDQSIYINDPDVVFLRYENITLTDTEKELVALVSFLFASQLMHSDDPVDFHEETDGKLTQKILSLYEKFDGQEWGLENLSTNTFIIFTRDKKYVGLINLSEKDFSVKRTELLSRAGEKTELVPVVQHVAEKGGVITAEKHSISIFEAK